MDELKNDVEVKGSTHSSSVPIPTLSIAAHHSFLRSLQSSSSSGSDSGPKSFEYYATDHLRMSGVYWAMMAADLLIPNGEHTTKWDDSNECSPLPQLAGQSRSSITQWVLQCYHPNGGFSGNVHHDPHLLYTLSAIQILILVDALHLIDVDLVSTYVGSLQQSDGSFKGDEWGEIDTRFSYCAIAALRLMGKLDSPIVNIPLAVEYLSKCRNFDGGFGAVVGAESHAGQIFCCMGAMAIVGCVDEYVDAGVLGWWLCERQLPCGGLNGRPEKREDVCYSWWVLSSLAILHHLDWIDREKLIEYILGCQDQEKGGISDRPNNMVDVFHLYFGLAGLSLLGYHEEGVIDKMSPIDPVYALPVRIVKKLKLTSTYDK